MKPLAQLRRLGINAHEFLHILVANFAPLGSKMRIPRL
jgi:hypothetical protein